MKNHLELNIYLKILLIKRLKNKKDSLNDKFAEMNRSRQKCTRSAEENNT